MDKNGVVAQRLFANWEIDRTSSSVVQRIFTLSVNRLILNALPSHTHALVLTAKLQGHKRTLRSNEIPISVNNSGGSQVDVDLHISFTIQYPHFLKGKVNCVQVLIQRRRRYKNRPIPGGFKTLAIGLVNLTQLLQQGSLREILLWNTEDLQKETSPNVQSIGKLSLTSCQSQPLDVDVSALKEKALGELSEDSETEDDDDADQPNDSDTNDPTSGRMRETRMRNKLAHRKNLKQKFVSLLRKFKVPEEEEAAFPVSASASVARAPTAKELEALFEELDDLSDSGPEGIAADEMSIGSNPRPGLQPYFSRERLPGLPPILDDRVSDSEGEGDGLSNEEWSSDAEAERVRREENEQPSTGTTVTEIQYPEGSKASMTTPRAPAASSTLNERLMVGRSATMSHSLTAGSIANKTERKLVGRNASVGDHVMAPVSVAPTDVSTISGECFWLCSMYDLPSLHTLSTLSSALPLVNCVNTQQVRTALAQIVAKIQNFCNSNSSPPPITWIGVIGNDKFVSQVLGAYVDIVQHKSSSHFLSSLRFMLIPPPNSLIGKLLAGSDPQVDTLCRELWERSHDMSVPEMKQIIERLITWPTNSAGCILLPIGEALLQMTEKEGQSVDSSRLFVPFLAEVRVGHQEDEGLDSVTNSPREREDSGPNKATEPTSSMGGSSSPPSSPHNRHETQEMHVEYWQGTSTGMELTNLPVPAAQGQQQSTPNKKDSKGSLKTAFKTLLVTRSLAQPLLSLTFVKEKKKDKMLQKLGMKNRQKSEPENPPVQVGNVVRLLCSATSKHSNLSVCVDGCVYPDVRFFQTSSQWPTHVRYLSVSLLSSTVNIHT